MREKIITLEPNNYTLTVQATRREFQELSCAMDVYLRNERHTSGDNPAWEFMAALAEKLEKIK